MTQQNLDPLSLYAGLNITHPATGIGASIQQAISRLLDKAENALNHLQTRRDGATLQNQRKTRKEAI